MFSKEKLSVMVAEFLGTAMLASVVLVVGHLFGSGTAAWYTALSAGLALTLIVGVVGHVSGAHVNPAITIGQWSLKKIATADAVVYIGSQLLGGATALLFYNYATGDSLPNVGGASFDWSVFWVEAVGAAAFGMGLAAVAAQKLEGWHAAFMVGMSLTFGSLLASVASAGFLNPAVALGFNSWNRTLVLAPIIGMVVGMQVYNALLVPSKKKR